ncbi:nucleotide-diphospho-sugar transferase [Aspergillus ambiguus]|uniref:nucleotide-diphospho-sugar transferase n=1 Tax=Aspergillus ambiguus TaxID=176160 RepID=UPI003CCC8FD9
MTPEDTFILLMVARQVASFIQTYGSRRCKPVQLPQEPKLLPKHVSVIVPTIEISDHLIATFRRMLANRPQEIIVVTTAALFDDLNALMEEYLTEKDRGVVLFRVLSVPHPNKRAQMAHAIEQAQGEIIVLADDDVFWPSTLLKYVLAVFDRKPNVGGVGALEEAYGLKNRSPDSITMWEAFAARCIHAKNGQRSASTYFDGNVSGISGRTGAYRAEILKDKKFLHAFTHEYWLFGRIHLHSGDDQFVTKWTFNQGWNTHIQTAPEALYYTRVYPDSRHIYQLLRWGRNHKRSHFKRLFTSKRLWKFPFLTYTSIDIALGPLIFAWEIFLAVRIYRSKPIPSGFGTNSPSKGCLIFCAWFLLPLIDNVRYGLQHRWWLRYVGAHYLRDLVYYVAMNVYVPLTLHYTGWGSKNA